VHNELSVFIFTSYFYRHEMEENLMGGT